MTPRERVFAILRWEAPDIIPWMNALDPLTFPGQKLRQLKDKGMGCFNYVHVYRRENPNVTVTETRKPYPEEYGIRRSYAIEEGEVTRRYDTPVGHVTCKNRKGLTYMEWQEDYPIKQPSDYDVMEYIFRDERFSPNYEPLIRAREALGEDGCIWAKVPKSPVSLLLNELMGYRRFSLDLYSQRDRLDKLAKVIAENQERLYRITADSPAEIVWCADNINGVVIGPKLFKKYYVPFYNRMASILHEKGKYYAIHMDGKLGCLLEPMKKANIDIIEAFTPPPMGDLPIEKARQEWGDKFIIGINFPETVCLGGPKAIDKFAKGLFKSIAPGDGFMLEVTEDIPMDILWSSLEAITDAVNKYGRYPIPA